MDPTTLLATWLLRAMTLIVPVDTTAATALPYLERIDHDGATTTYQSRLETADERLTRYRVIGMLTAAATHPAAQPARRRADPLPRPLTHTTIQGH